MASHSLNITHNSVYNQCCTVCGCPEGASTQNIVCHYVLLGWRLGTIAWKKCYFQKQSFPTQQRHIQAISCVFWLRDFWCECICHGFQRCIQQQRQNSSPDKNYPFQTFALSFKFYLLLSMSCVTIIVAGVFAFWQLRYNKRRKPLPWKNPEHMSTCSSCLFLIHHSFWTIIKSSFCDLISCVF